jgi:molybdopterin molybdotransferase
MIFKTDSYISADCAFTKIFQNIKINLETKFIPVFDSKSYVLKEDIISKDDIPITSSSHMDGFALKSEDTICASEDNPLSFKISSNKSILGKHTSYILKSGEVYRIQTGGYLPYQSDAVIPIENVTRVDEKTIKIFLQVKKGSCVYPVGEDIKKGEKVLFKGQLIRAQEMSFLASLKISKIPVFRKPIVSVIPTGTELTDEIKEKKWNKVQKIINTNSHVISCIIEEIGGIPIDFGVTPDKSEILKKKIKIAIKKSDIILTIGGSSVGEHDIIESVINSLGTPGVLVHGVKLDRGRVSGLAVINDKPIIILPGPIQGALNAFIVFVRPLIRTFSGLPLKSDLTIFATITENWHSRQKFYDFKKIVYVKVSKYKDKFLATPVTGETQSISLLIKSNGYIIVPEDITNINEGDIIEINLLPGFSYIKDSLISK